MRIVHLARDEKFVPLMQSLFEEAFPGSNRWVIARKRRAKQRHVADGANVRFRGELAMRLGLARGDVADADILVLHSLAGIFLRSIAQVRPNCKVVWIGWGYDYYPLLEPQLGALTLPATRTLAGAAAEEDAATGSKRSALAEAAPRIDVCCVVPTELSMLRKALPALRAQPHDLPLFTVEDVFDRGPAAMDGPDVLLGNSATSSNNHVEAIELLKGRLDDDARVIAPLSYGDATYGQKVAEFGARLLGDRFEPLRGWMPIEAYNERIGRCGFVVMNHRRQQAVGNIGTALYKGATVHLRPENPLFEFYRSLGVTLRSVDELAAGLIPITDAQRLANRAAIARYYSRASVVDSIRRLA